MKKSEFLKSLADAIWRIVRLVERIFSKRHGHFDFVVAPSSKLQKESLMLTVKITNEQQVVVTLNPKTDSGKPAKLDGIPTWEKTGDGLATIEVAPDGMSATLISADDPGITQFLVSGDADLGEGVEPISDTITLDVSSATAKNLGLTVGTPTNKPMPTP